jgi:type I restriction enzyme S subunit
MIDGLKPYPAYKDSGVPWLGDLPEHWDSPRLKTVFREVDRRSGTGEEPLLSLRMQQGLVDHHAMGGKPIPPSSLINYKRTEPGDIVMNRMRAAAGLFAATPTVGLVSPDYAVLRPRMPVEPQYFVHLFRTPSMMSVFRSESRGLGTGESGFLRLYAERFGLLQAPRPPLDEQAAIVRFLEHADRRIRRYISAKQMLIKLLEEHEQAIMYQAVTRGLDPNVRLKPSGAIWLGEVPENWEVRKLGTLGTFYKGRGIGKADITETGVPAVTYGDIYTRYGIEAKALAKCTSPEVAANAQEIMSGDLLFTASGETIEDIGKTTLYTGDVPAYAGGDIVVLRLVECDGLYLSYVLNSSLGVQQKSALGRGDIIVHISAAKLRQITVPLPPQQDQSAIARFLDNAMANIKGAIHHARREISLLSEYRTLLIADVVTGKVDVREAAARLPGEGEEPESLDEDDVPTGGEQQLTDELDALPEEAEA